MELRDNLRDGVIGVGGPGRPVRDYIRDREESKYSA